MSLSGVDLPDLLHCSERLPSPAFEVLHREDLAGNLPLQ
jgi:hypothetical protein